ncbi:MAG: hypothetical protein MHM6MM_004695 [Cercozoa sp. M6MM]
MAARQSDSGIATSEGVALCGLLLCAAADRFEMHLRRYTERNFHSLLRRSSLQKYRADTPAERSLREGARLQARLTRQLQKRLNRPIIEAIDSHEYHL